MPLRDLSDHTEYVPGKGATEVARERGLDPDNVLVLSSNENALGPSDAAVASITSAAPGIHRYPKSSHIDLTQALADRWQVNTEQIWLANGGDGALDYLSRAIIRPGDRVLVPNPGFAYYAMSARFHHGTASQYSLSKADDFRLTAEMILAAFSDERIIYITSPHNPTGSTIAIDEIERIADATPTDTIVVVDEAYGAFSSVDSAVSLVQSRDDVAVLRSFSKLYGLAGIRLGYAIVPPSWQDAYSRINTPFSVSELACQAGRAALTDSDHVTKTIEMTQNGRELIRGSVDAPSWPSGGNFILVDVGDAARVTDALVDRGVIVRDCTSFGLPSCIRLTTAPEPDLRRAVSALNSVMDDGAGGEQ